MKANEFKPRHDPAKAVTYARVSSPSQAVEGKESLVWQTKTASDYATQQGWELVAKFEEAVSGRKLERPEFSKIMEMAQVGKIDYVVIALLSREARNFAVSAILRAQLEQFGVQVVYTDADTSTREGQRLTDLRRLFYEWERDEIEARLARGKLQAIEKREVMGTGRHAQPLGWRYNKDTQAWEHDPDEVAIVQMIYRWLADEGISLNQVAKRLTAMGVKPRNSKVWQTSTIAYMVKNTMHYGVWYYNKFEATKPENPRLTGIRRKDKTSKILRSQEEWIAYDVPPIVSKEVWDRAQATIEANRNHPKYDHATFRYLVNYGRIICDLCGSTMQGFHVEAKKKGRYRLYYRCKGKSTLHQIHGKEKCTAPYLRAERVDELVWQAVMNVLTNPHIPFSAATNPETDEQAQRDQETLASISSNEATLRNRLNTIMDAYETGDYDKETFRERKALVDRELANIATQKEAILDRIEERQQAKADVEALQLLSATFRQFNPNPPFEAKRRVIEALNVKVYSVGDKDKNIRIEGLISDMVMPISLELNDAIGVIMESEPEGFDDFDPSPFANNSENAKGIFNHVLEKVADAANKSRGIVGPDTSTDSDSEEDEDGTDTKEKGIEYRTTPERLP